jgi:hypothetical protein
VDWSVRIVEQLERVFDSYRMVFRELTGKISGSHHDVFAKKEIFKNNTKTLFG